jgi:class 3 adenylate cyclase
MAQKDLKRKLAAILSADVTEYSRLMRDDETATIRTLTTYRKVMTALIKQHHGRVVDAVGDNLLAEFASVVDAVQGAVAIQKEITSRNVQMPESRRMLFRIGINLGDLVVEGDRIYGDGVNIAARLEALADPGGICISRTAFDQIEDKLPLGYEYLGEKTVKNIVKPVRAYRVLLEPEEATPSVNKTEQARRSKRHEKIEGKTKRRRTKQEKRDKHYEDKLKKSGTKLKVWDSNWFHKHLRIYGGVIGFLFIVNMLTWGGSIWVQWPALGWGLLIFLKWVNTDKKNGVRYKDKAKIRLHKHLGTYLSVIGFLFIVNMLTWGGSIWVQWPALGWGLLLFLHWAKDSNASSRRKP